MAVDKSYNIWLGTSSSSGNVNKLQILGVVIFLETITNQHRLQLLNGTITLVDLKVLYPALTNRIDQEAKNFTSKWSNDGLNHTHYLGEFNATQLFWTRLQNVLASAPSDWKYVQFSIPGSVLLETNINAFSGLVGTVQNPRQLIADFGLEPYPVGNGNLIKIK
jgi:hypothetical protein